MNVWDKISQTIIAEGQQFNQVVYWYMRSFLFKEKEFIKEMDELSKTVKPSASTAYRAIVVDKDKLQDSYKIKGIQSWSASKKGVLNYLEANYHLLKGGKKEPVVVMFKIKPSGKEILGSTAQLKKAFKKLGIDHLVEMMGYYKEQDEVILNINKDIKVDEVLDSKSFRPIASVWDKLDKIALKFDGKIMSYAFKAGDLKVTMLVSGKIYNYEVPMNVAKGIQGVKPDKNMVKPWNLGRFISKIKEYKV